LQNKNIHNVNLKYHILPNGRTVMFSKFGASRNLANAVSIHVFGYTQGWKIIIFFVPFLSCPQKTLPLFLYIPHKNPLLMINYHFFSLA